MATIPQRFHYWLNNTRRNLRYIYPSPAEMEFARLMGARTITIKRLTNYRTHFPMSFIWWKGRFLRREFMQREVRVGPYFCDYYFESAYARKAIEIDGATHKLDIVYDQQRDDYLASRGVQVMRIEARDLWKKPDEVIRRTRNFLAK